MDNLLNLLFEEKNLLNMFRVKHWEDGALNDTTIEPEIKINSEYSEKEAINSQ